MNDEKDMSQGHDAAAAGGVTPVNNTRLFFRYKWLVVGACAAVVVVVSFILFRGSGSGNMSLFPATGTVDGHDYVDMGLSVKWATCNVGASSPYEYGDYFAWGETTTKSKYTSDNCKIFGLCIDDIAGNPFYDAARANWRGSWRMPTKAEMQELIDKCTWTWTTHGGHNGCKVTSNINGNSIFLPAAGWHNGGTAGDFGGYWSSMSDGPAYRLDFDFFDPFNGEIRMCLGNRSDGFSVRPVMD